MNAPTKSDLISLGYRMSANATDAVVSRCAGEVLENYILRYVEQSDVTAAQLSDEIGRAWAVLTFLRYSQEEQFATRTGAERKRFEWGDRLTWMNPVKTEAARRLADLYSVHTVDGEVSDICGVFFATQLFN